MTNQSFPAKREPWVLTCLLEEALESLCQYGKPRLSQTGAKPGTREWFCGLDMFVTGAGVEFKIQSRFNHPTAIEAVSDCYNKMKEALSTLGVKL